MYFNSKGLSIYYEKYGDKKEQADTGKGGFDTNRLDKALEITQAVMKTELAELTREVRIHNGFAQRMPVVEEQIKVINHRIAELEKSN